MIHHISISAQDPRRVSEVLAELWQGYSMPFPPFPGAYIVLPGDAHGSAIEVGPLGTELVPGLGDQEAQATFNENPSPYTATHAALSVPASVERIREVAAREGWRAEIFDRGPFKLVEVWIENRLLVEMLPPSMQGDYLAAMTPENLAAFFGHELARPGAHEEELEAVAV
ncbi:MAG TPA: hypothetical protein VEY09_14765 [Pyrinomonadaceae bacterium]|nr:hypothetical protein [Pyrinomonadaceae bacterium]